MQRDTLRSGAEKPASREAGRRAPGLFAELDAKAGCLYSGAIPKSPRVGDFFVTRFTHTDMFDLKVINSVLAELEEERGIPRERIIEAIESALATAYRKEYGKKGQIVRSKFDMNTGKAEFFQIKEVADESSVRMEEEENLEDERPRYNPEHHILLEDAKRIKRDAKVDDEITFPLEAKDDFGRIAAQTAKQVIIQKIREAEKASVVSEYGEREGQIVTGTVQRIERGNIFIDLGRATGIIPYDEQIPGERYRQGERVRAYLYEVEESPRGIFLRLSRSHPKFLEKLFAMEAPEVESGAVVIKAVAREAGSRSKIAVASVDQHVDPVGSMVGQRGVRVSTVMSELGGEKIDIIEWSENPTEFIQDALSPAKVMKVTVDLDERQATVEVSEDQQSLAIGKGGQNVRLAAKLTGFKIDIRGLGGASLEREKPRREEAALSEAPAEEPAGEEAPAAEPSEEKAAE
jgi:transcription termination/antitermination protein NusA